jgi:transcriptional regulator with XRE-family HTH domain
LSRAISRTVGARLRAARAAQRLTQPALAGLSGVDTATISNMERGRMVGSLDCHLRLSRALGLTLAELYDGLVHINNGRS